MSYALSLAFCPNSSPAGGAEGLHQPRRTSYLSVLLRSSRKLVKSEAWPSFISTALHRTTANSSCCWIRFTLENSSVSRPSSLPPPAPFIKTAAAVILSPILPSQDRTSCIADIHRGMSFFWDVALMTLSAMYAWMASRILGSASSSSDFCISKSKRKMSRTKCRCR